MDQQRLGLPAPWHSPSFISVRHCCSVSKARVVFPGGSYSTGALHGSQGIQNKGRSPAGHWEVEGGSAMGRARDRDSAQGSAWKS